MTRKLTTDLWDRAAWLNDADLDDQAWINAMVRIDQHGDKTELIKLLRGSGSQRDWYLADLLDRYQLEGPKKGRRRTPAYDRTAVEARLHVHCERVRERVVAGASVEAALAQEAADFQIDPDSLSKAYHGTRGGSQRARKRAYPPKKAKG
jgi:hypothetical protein